MNESASAYIELTDEDASVRLARDGYNELPSAQPRSMLAIAWEVLREPMFLLLIAASTIYLVLGDLREAMVLFGSVFVVMGITFYQERKTERALGCKRRFGSLCSLVRLIDQDQEVNWKKVRDYIRSTD